MNFIRTASHPPTHKWRIYWTPCNATVWAAKKGVRYSGGCIVKCSELVSLKVFLQNDKYEVI